jgi:hypothetical protein
MKLIFRAFKAIEEPDLCRRFLQGHQKVLVSYGITNITTNTADWMKWDCVYGVVAENEEGEVLGGVRIHLADGEHALPVEKAIGKMDPKIHEIVKAYINDGVGELCALWNGREVAGLGVSIMIVRAGISVVSQLKCSILMGICADYTLKMFSKVGFVVDNSLGNKGEFVYPNENYVARVLGILNAKDLASAEEYDRQKMLDLRNNPEQTCIEQGPGDKTVEIEYLLSLKKLSAV